MKRMLINSTQQDHLRVAIVDGAQLTNLVVKNPQQDQKIASIHKGIITSLEPSLGAVFVNYGAQRHGFLPLKEISPEYFLTQDYDRQGTPDLNTILKVGQPLVIQVEKEERGTKGAALTTFISLAGSFLVLMPNNPRAGGISRRIEGDERDQLREAMAELAIPDGMGVIVRTAGVGRSKEELAWDLSMLLRYWEAVKQAATVKQGPYLIHQESDIIITAIRDYLPQDIDEIIVDDKDAFQRAYNYLSQTRPNIVDRLKLYSEQLLPLFSRFQIEQQIENAYQREVRLPSGGSLIIDHTEALVTIDVNSASATKGSDIEETAFNTNLEAAETIARELRIRDIGGLVVIDFIDMTPARHQRDVENCLRNALRQDRARIQVGKISRFGLLEMSRQRLRPSLVKTSHITCPRCHGQGRIRSVESQALSIIHLVQEQAARVKNLQFEVQLPVDIATYIMNEKRQAIIDIECHYEAKITLIANQFLESPQYYLKQLRQDEGRGSSGGVPSYKIAKTMKTEPASKKTNMQATSEPAINRFLSQPTDVVSPTKASSGGLIKRLWSIMFGSDTATSTQERRQQQAPKKQARRKSTRSSSSSTTRHKSKPQSKSRSSSPSHKNSGHPKKQTRRGSRGGQRRSQGHHKRPGGASQAKPAGSHHKPETKRPSSQAKKNDQTSSSSRPAQQSKKPRAAGVRDENKS